MWIKYCGQVAEILNGLIVTGKSGDQVPAEEAFASWVDRARSLARGGSLHFIGNGASASMASHFATDITKNCGIRSSVFTDCALITALGNDLGFENAYAAALARYALRGDLLVAISSSGNSPNIINACREAERLGVCVVTITGKKPDNPVRSLGLLNFYVPAATFSLAESAHAVILHHWTDRLEAVCKGAS